MTQTESLVIPRSDAVQDKALASDANTTVSSGDSNNVPSSRLAAEADDIFAITPLVALQLLCASVEALVRITGDVPPTPPLEGAGEETNMREMEAEKASIVRTLSANSLARLREQAEKQSAARTPPSVVSSARMPPTPPPVRPAAAGDIDGVHMKTTPEGTGPAALHVSSQPEPYLIIGADSQPLNVQHSAISRKFYSKAVPPFSISQYLMRLHRYCPMSTAVYLATSLYIYRLAVTDKVIAVTRRNSHRLLLAGLRVAMKALEDRSHPHAKMSKVGGVSEAELARLEIHFCFLVGFDVTVQAHQIQQHWLLMKRGEALGSLDKDQTAALTAVMARVA